MVFIETFGAVFTATVIGQFVIWWFKKEVEHRLDNGYSSIKNRLKFTKKESGGTQMTKKLVIDIDFEHNGGLVVTWYKKSGSGFMGIKMKDDEKSINVFKSTAEFAKWLDEVEKYL